MAVDIAGSIKIVPVMCKCKETEIQARNERFEYEDRMNRLRKIQDACIMDTDFRQSTFENFEFNADNKGHYNIARKYVDKWEDVKANNYGLLFYGIPGNGKTYLSCCIANALQEKMVSAVIVGAGALLDRFKDNYGRFGDNSDIQIIQSLTNADLLIIDDLGAERKTEWSVDKLYSIIDKRYRDKKPTVISTNLSLDELREHLSTDGVYRTYDRIIEMTTPIEFKGKSRRKDKAKENISGLKKLLEL